MYSDMTPGYKWKPVEDLPDNPSELTSGELDALYLVWNEQSQILGQTGSLQRFHERLQREWSIETGEVEGVYHLDRGTTQLLIERGLDASLIPHDSAQKDPELVARMLLDHQEVLEGLFAFVRGERDLTVGYIKEVHAALLRHQDTSTVVDQFGRPFEKELEKGSYKRLPNNPTRPNGSTHEYCPPEHVASEMDRMVTLHQEHAKGGAPPEVQAAWLHHAFTQVHPFQDGNGRVARAIATLVFLKAGCFPLVITRDDRPMYIEALETADQGDIKPFVSLLADIQKRALLQALELASEVRPPQTVDECVAAARAVLVARRQMFPPQWNQVKEAAGRLQDVAGTRLRDVANKLQYEIASVRPQFQFSLESGSGDFTAPREVAAQLKYVANLAEYHQWVQLNLKTEESTKFIVSFHGLGREFRGFLAVSALLVNSENRATPVSDDFFQLNYKEAYDQAQRRFRPWLESVIVKGLSLWNRRLRSFVPSSDASPPQQP